MGRHEPAPHLVAFDLDGTALAASNRMPPRTREALEAAHRMGCLVVVATGRALSMVPAFLREAPWVDYLIVSNGARVVRARTGETIYSRVIPPDLAAAVMEANPEAAWEVLFPDGCVAEWRSYFRYRDYRGRPNWSLSRLRAWLTMFRPVWSAAAVVRRQGRPVEKLDGIFRDQASAARALQRIRAQGELQVVSPRGHDVEVSARGADKGSALAWLAGRVGVPKEGIIAFGDSENDLSMAGAAGLFVAMGDAPPHIKEVAGAVAPSVDEDGLGVFLQEWLEKLASQR